MTAYVNLSRIQETSDGDIEFELELIEMFLDDAKEHVQSIINNIDSKDTETLKQVAHTLKGASANIGATALLNVAYDIEIATQIPENPMMFDYKEKLTRAYDNTFKFFMDYKDKIS